MKLHKIVLASAVIAGVTSSSFATIPAMAVESLAKETVTASNLSHQEKKLISASIRLYSEPSSTSESITSISRNSLAYSEGEVSGSYTKINYNGITGWAESRFVKEYIYDAEIEAAIKPGNRTIIASLSVNSKPDTKSEKLASVARDSKVYFTGELYDKFSKITVNGVTGWVESRFVTAYEGNEVDTNPNSPEDGTKPPTEPNLPEDSSEARNVQITASVYIREKPNASSNKISLISRLS